MKKRVKKMFWIFIAAIAVLAGGIGAFLCHPMFGKLPSGERLKKIQTIMARKFNTAV